MNGRHVINLSTAWEPPDPAAGRATWTRRFGTPAGLEPGDRVWLVIEPAVSCQATLQGEPLPSVAAGRLWRHDVTGRLGPRNDLVLIAAVAISAAPVCSSAHGRLPLPAAIGSVRLEVHPGGPNRTGVATRA